MTDLHKATHASWKTLYISSRISLLGMEILFKFVGAYIVMPLLGRMIAGSLRLLPARFLSVSLPYALRGPFYVAALIFAGIIVCFWSLAEIGILVCGINRIKRGEHVLFKTLLPEVAAGIRRACHGSCLGILVLAGLWYPINNIVLTARTAYEIVPWRYIFQFIPNHPGYIAAALFAAGVLAAFMIHDMFVFHAFFLGKEDFTYAREESHARIRGKALRCFGIVVWYKVRVFLMGGVPALVTGLVIRKLLDVLDMSNITLAAMITLYYFAFPLICYTLDIFCMISQYSMLGTLFYLSDGWTGEVVPPTIRKSFRSRIFVPGCIGAVCVICAVSMAAVSISPDFFLENLTNSDVEVTAHRGYKVSAPENTMSAFQAAIDGQVANCIELDVQETLDGVVVVSHDVTLERMTGVNLKICDLTYAQVQELTVTSENEDGEVFTDVIPRLVDVVKLCKDQIPLEIEIKANEKTPDLEKHTVQILEENGCTDQCSIVSQNYYSLAKVKKLNPDIETGYILTMSAGKYYDLPAADFFSVKYVFVNKKTVREIHRRHKKIAVWTVNSDEIARKMLQMGVDNLITDDPDGVSAVIVEQEENPLRLLDQLKLW